MRSRRILSLTIWLLGTSLTLSTRAADQQAFNTFDAANKVSQILLKIAPDEREFFVREFRGVASSNVGLSKLVGDCLEKEGRVVRAGAPCELEGRLFRLPRNESEELKGFTIEGAVVMPSGSTRRFSVDVMNRDDGHATVTDTEEVGLPPAEDFANLREGGPTLVGDVLRPSPDSPYGVEVLIETGPGQYRSVTPSKSGGVFKVNLTPGAIYAVKLHNGSEFEAAVDTRIDGLSRFALADDPALSNCRDLVRSKSTRIITGYFRDGETVDSFQIGKYSQSVAAAKLPSSVDAGSVTCVFSAAWKRTDPPPPNEPDVAKDEPLGTLKGPPRRDPTERVDRVIGAVRAVVKIRY